MRRIILLALVGSLAACSKSKLPKDVLEPEKMQAVYWDYLRADIFANEHVRLDSSKNLALENAKLQLQVFQLHKISKEQFYKSYEYYLNHRELMKDMLDTMLVRQKQKIEKPADSLKARMDSVKATRPKIIDSIMKIE